MSVLGYDNGWCHSSARLAWRESRYFDCWHCQKILSVALSSLGNLISSLHFAKKSQKLAESHQIMITHALKMAMSLLTSCCILATFWLVHSVLHSVHVVIKSKTSQLIFT